jgi:hypothetical protein
MTIAISLVELQLHIAEALSGYGIGVEAFEVLLDEDGGWHIQLHGNDPALSPEARARAVSNVETTLGLRFKVHRLSLGGAYGG